MTRARSFSEDAIRGFAVCAALLFALSLAYGIFAYAGPFEELAAPQSDKERYTALATDILLFTAFALHHSFFARTGLKQRLVALVSPRLERSVYVLVASVLFIVICAAWQPVSGIAWHVSAPWSALLLVAQFGGVLITAVASGRLDVVSLAGLRQAFGWPSRTSGLLRTGLYRLVRHPIYLGWLLMVWPTPHMNGTRLVFAAVSTLYLALAIPFEERALRREFGRAYADYATAVRWRMLPFVY